MKVWRHSLQTRFILTVSKPEFKPKTKMIFTRSATTAVLTLLMVWAMVVVLGINAIEKAKKYAWVWLLLEIPRITE
jgi:hypothetical protein